MSFLANLFGRKSSAPIARDRLQILLAHERVAGEGQSELIAKLQEEILEVIKRHLAIDQDKVQIKMDRGTGVSMLEIDIEVPEMKALEAKASEATNKVEQPEPSSA
ncbi:cell division topological specificity factor MinE [Nguyenibacter sp. L1]|uniref:cell division topological specificity factor MinE n=1 Tax=Nguyenibacter sp. L1 TaxID=3049350 RepID=UPI002B45B545|nr:cell division topological specificity factor MinE [Nguyenibacter sp. L1]WRH88517.1 cell division topological specificity factor MinE [Nguyenibacter sp. L1]